MILNELPYQSLFIVCHHCRYRNLFTFSSSYPKPLGTIHHLVKGEVSFQGSIIKKEFFKKEVGGYKNLLKIQIICYTQTTTLVFTI